MQIAYDKRDHVEIYQNIKGDFVIIFSNYDNIDASVLLYSYKKYNKLYSINSNTYIKILPRLKKSYINDGSLLNFCKLYYLKHKTIHLKIKHI